MSAPSLCSISMPRAAPLTIRGWPSTPLRGLPVGFKDIFDTADLPTQYGSPIYAGYRPRADASRGGADAGAPAASSSARR